MPEKLSATQTATARPPTAADREQFARLAERWKTDTAFSSSPDEIARHPAYREIVQMGEVAIPLILAELEAHPDHWFTALKELAGADPVPPASRGRMKEMVAAWVGWGRTHGIKW